MSFARCLASAAAVGPHAGRGVISPSGENCLLSIVVGFGVVTLFATGLLFVMHMLEDFLGA